MLETGPSYRQEQLGSIGHKEREGGVSHCIMCAHEEELPHLLVEAVLNATVVMGRSVDAAQHSAVVPWGASAPSSSAGSSFPEARKMKFASVQHLMSLR